MGAIDNYLGGWADLFGAHSRGPGMGDRGEAARRRTQEMAREEGRYVDRAPERFAAVNNPPSTVAPITIQTPLTKPPAQTQAADAQKLGEFLVAGMGGLPNLNEPVQIPQLGDLVKRGLTGLGGLIGQGTQAAAGVPGASTFATYLDKLLPEGGGGTDGAMSGAPAATQESPWGLREWFNAMAGWKPDVTMPNHSANMSRQQGDIADTMMGGVMGAFRNYGQQLQDAYWNPEVGNAWRANQAASLANKDRESRERMMEMLVGAMGGGGMGGSGAGGGTLGGGGTPIRDQNSGVYVDPVSGKYHNPIQAAPPRRNVAAGAPVQNLGTMGQEMSQTRNAASATLANAENARQQQAMQNARQQMYAQTGAGLAGQVGGLRTDAMKRQLPYLQMASQMIG